MDVEIGGNIGKAIDGLFLEKKYTRLGWQTTEKWISLYPSGLLPMSSFRSHQNRVFAQENGGFAKVSPYVNLHLPDGESVPYCPTHEDLLSSDWVSL